MNLWLAVFVALGVFLLNVPVPTPLATALLIAATVPCALGSWALLVRCTEVESELDM